MKLIRVNGTLETAFVKKPGHICQFQDRQILEFNIRSNFL